MDNRGFYKQVLGVIAPWEVVNVDTNIEQDRVDIYIEWPQGRLGICPKCNKETKIHDRREERLWRHLDTCQLKTFIHCLIPRVKCSAHKVKTMEIPWASDMSHFTKLFEKLAIDFLLASRNRTKVANLLRISWDEMNHIMNKAVKRGLEKRDSELIEMIGMDEKSFLKGHKYVTVMSDIVNKRIIDVSEGRKTESVDKLWQNLSEPQRENVKAVSMDFWRAFISGAQKFVPNADIVHDKFHIASYLGKAVDTVRRIEHKRLSIDGDKTLLNTKYIFLKKKENLTEKQKDIFKKLNIAGLEVGKAWQLKELFRNFWDYKYKKSANDFFERWFNSAIETNLEPVIKVAKMLKDHFENIITYLKHRITNAFAEGINSQIQLIKSTARGFRNFNNYRTSILFYCGKLELYP
jgi:transposase